MSFLGFEISNHSGKPVTLYEFTWGNTVWRYTSSDRVMDFLGEEWEPKPISDNGVTQGENTHFEVRLPSNLALVDVFRGTPPSDSIWLRVYDFHYGDVSGEYRTKWVGTVGNIKRKTRAESVVIGLPISGTMRRTGLRLCWELQCPHMLYDQDCKANKELFKTVATITDMDNVTITVDSVGAFSAVQYQGGFFEWEVNDDGTIDRRGIEQHLSGTTFRVFGTTDRLEIGTEITMYLGCDLTPVTCQSVFNNLPNHGGYEMMPRKSPFDGNPVF